MQRTPSGTIVLNSRKNSIDSQRQQNDLRKSLMESFTKKKITKQQMEQILMKKQKEDQNFKIINQNNSKYSYIPLDIDILSSQYTDNDEEFQKCVNLIKVYNKEVQSKWGGGVEIENGPWKNQFYGTLQNMLLEIKFTKQRTLQQAYTQKLSEWVDVQLNQEQKKRNKAGMVTPQNIFQQSINLKTLRSKRSNTGQTTTTQTLRNANDTTQASINIANNDLGQQSPLKTQQSLVDQNQFQSVQDQQEGQQQDMENKDQQQQKRHQRSRTHQVQFQTSQMDQQKDMTLSSKQSKQFQKRPLKLQKAEKQLPSEYIKEVNRDYLLGHRTKIEGIQPAEERLQDFKRKNFSMPQEQMEKIDPFKVQNKWVFPRPQGYLTDKQIELPADIEQELKLGENDQNAQQNIGGEQQNLNNADGDVILDAGEAAQEEDEEGKVIEDRGEFALIPKVKNFQYDKVSKDQIRDDVNENFEARSKYTHYKPTNTEAELRMEKKYFENRQKEIQEKREAEEMVGMMNNWANNKARLEKEINRKYESKRYGNDFKRLQFEPKKYEKLEVQQIIADAKVTLEEEQQEIDLQLAIEKKEKELQLLQARAQKETTNSMKENLQKQIAPIQAEYDNLKQELEIIKEGKIVKKDSTKSKLKNFRHIKSNTIHGEINNRYSTNQNGTKFPLIAKSHLGNNKVTSFHNLENIMSQRKVDLAKQQYGNLIGLGIKPKNPENDGEQNEDSEEDQSQKPQVRSLSIYSRDFQKSHRPFSAVFDMVNRDTLRQEQLREVIDIKNRMAKHKINIQMKKLIDSMVIPANIEGPGINCIPAPGMMLYEDLFAKEAASKKKKKGKKK